MRTLKSHGKRGDCEDAAVKLELPVLREKPTPLAVKYAFNAHKFGLNYNRPPNITISSQHMQGRKKAKETLSALACFNADESEKIPLMIIGSAWKPREFKKMTGIELGFDYQAS